MEVSKFHKLSFVLVLISIPVVHGWGIDGHLIICRLAQARLSKAAEDAVSQLLPAYAQNDLSSVCSWADRVKFRYHWSSPLHYLNTPDNLCTYQYNRDCKDEDGILDMCVSGAINNYTTQLLSYGNSSFSSSSSSRSDHDCNPQIISQKHFSSCLISWGTFISLYMWDSLQTGEETPLMFIGTIGKKFFIMYGDNSIIETAEARFYDSDVNELIDALQKNITTVWSSQAQAWEACNQTACPDQYASEGIRAACDWAYKGVEEDSVLEDDYFLSRRTVVNLRLVQGGVRLAATLNRIFG